MLLRQFAKKNTYTEDHLIVNEYSSIKTNIYKFIELQSNRLFSAVLVFIFHALIPIYCPSLYF